MNFQKVLPLAFSLLLMQGCAGVYKPQNVETQTVYKETGYYLYGQQPKSTGAYSISLSFSGGGTRAAALSYGVLKELRDTQVDTRDGSRVRLLDEIDSISSVSGGSFTSAYYGLFGEQIFEDYESRFLRQSVQGTLIRKLFSPVYWWRSLFTGFDRTEMAVEYYDKNVFRGKTFADIPRSGRPFIEINATDLNSGSRFTFTQGYFDVICSDLGPFSVARAVTASSAVPVAFPPIVLKNYADTCDIEQNPMWETVRANLSKSERSQATLQSLLAMRNAKEHPYIHLVDGGISDNLGLRALLDRVEALGGVMGAFERNPNFPKDVLVILVNAEVKPKRSFDQSAEKPSIGQTIGAISSAQIGLYNVETLSLIREKIKQFQQQAQASGLPTQFYFVDLSFESITQPSIKEFFNSLPTSLELSNTEVDTLIEAGRQLLRSNQEYKRFLQANHGKVERHEPSEIGCSPLDVACWMRTIAGARGEKVPEEPEKR